MLLDILLSFDLALAVLWSVLSSFSKSQNLTPSPIPSNIINIKPFCVSHHHPASVLFNSNTALHKSSAFLNVKEDRQFVMVSAVRESFSTYLNVSLVVK